MGPNTATYYLYPNNPCFLEGTQILCKVNDKAVPWNSDGNYTIWHFALENDNDYMNYGVYANGGLLVETCSKFFMNKFSNLSLVKQNS